MKCPRKDCNGNIKACFSGESYIYNVDPDKIQKEINKSFPAVANVVDIEWQFDHFECEDCGEEWMDLEELKQEIEDE